MGLIKAAAGAIGSTFHDQWKEAIRCEDMVQQPEIARGTQAFRNFTERTNNNYIEKILEQYKQH